MRKSVIAIIAALPLLGACGKPTPYGEIGKYNVLGEIIWIDRRYDLRNVYPECELEFKSETASRPVETYAMRCRIGNGIVERDLRDASDEIKKVREKIEADYAKQETAKASR